ncbi:hypothetical protein ACHHYP_09548 [Achlya hypogyna]|uniref:Transmembrane protein n=1 Tax=Achlya hypogyna TaxID=1202772 RepID=A0A1V9YN17_ACHHY|nr:hypothetical protein ACHHYP_09548 [Achlya hypogyna]
MAREANAAVKALDIRIFQYLQFGPSDTPVHYAVAALFNASDPAYGVFGWNYLADWALGHREVVSFQGDSGMVTLVSATAASSSSTPNALEVPTNLSVYCRLCIQYTTLLMTVVATITCGYCLLVRFWLEGINVTELNRVGAVVWVGRPLLCVRSLVAVALLSTASVSLVQVGGNTMTQAFNDSPPLLLTLLSGSEATWLVLVLSDFGSVYTRNETNAYAFLSVVLVWLIATIQRIVAPVTPVVTVARTCVTAAFDEQLQCHAGDVRIGSPARLMQTVVAAACVTVTCFAVVRRWWPQTLPKHKLSLLVTSGAHYLFDKKNWIGDDVWYLDAPSAFLTGLLSVCTAEATYVFDIKTWRCHRLERDVVSKGPLDAQRFKSAVPLVE